MQYYNDKENQAGAKILFMFLQMIVLVIVCIFIYTAFLAVGFTIDKNGMSQWMYFPVVMALVIFPVSLYRYRQMFNTGHWLLAISWVMGTASLTIVLLYAYIAQLTK